MQNKENHQSGAESIASDSQVSNFAEKESEIEWREFLRDETYLSP